MDEVRDRRDGDWFWMNKSIIEDYGQEIGVHGIAIYAALALYAARSGSAVPSLRTLARKLDMGTSTLQRYLDKLVETKLIERHKRKSVDGDFTSNEYILLKIKEKDGGVPTVNTPVPTVNTPVPTVNTPVPTVNTRVYPQQIHGVPTVNTEQEDLNKKDLEQEKPPSYIPPVPDPSIDTLSAPAKVKRAKKHEASNAAQQVLVYLNTIHQRDFETSSKIEALLVQGKSIEDLRLVIDWAYAVERIENPSGYAKYFNTVTPFRLENFDRLRNRALQWDREGRPSSSITPNEIPRPQTEAEWAAYLTAPSEGAL